MPSVADAKESTWIQALEAIVQRRIGCTCGTACGSQPITSRSKSAADEIRVHSDRWVPITVTANTPHRGDAGTARTSGVIVWSTGSACPLRSTQLHCACEE